MQDNSSPHNSSCSNSISFLKKLHIEVMEWLANSQDFKITGTSAYWKLEPIRRYPYSRIVIITLLSIRTLIVRMPARCAEVIRNREGHSPLELL